MRLRLIGIGPGGPDDLTVAAVKALESVDVFLVADKQRGVDDLVMVREQILGRHTTGRYRTIVVPDPPRDRAPEQYGTEVRDWHAARAQAYEAVLHAEVRDDETVGFLVWGDPSLYDSTIRVVERIRDRGVLDIDYDVVPGVSSIQLLAARHRLVFNRIGGPITITTGRRSVRKSRRAPTISSSCWTGSSPAATSTATGTSGGERIWGRVTRRPSRDAWVTCSTPSILRGLGPRPRAAG